MPADSRWIRKTGTCACGCGASLAGLNVSCRYTPECAARVKRERRAKVIALPARRHMVRNQYTETSYAPREPRPIKCSLCCGMPWARSERRLDQQFDAIGVRGADGVVRCRGCGEPYAPETGTERAPEIHSSAGMVLT